MRESLFLVSVVALTALAARREPVVRAERLELISPTGERRALLAADSTGVVLTLLDARGRPVSMLRLDEKRWLAVQDGQGAEMARLGYPKVRELTE